METLCLYCNAINDYKEIPVNPGFTSEITAAFVTRLYKIGDPHPRATSTNYGYGKFALNYCPMCGRNLTGED